MKNFPLYNIKTSVVTGFMDAGKTTYIQDYIFRDFFHKRQEGKTMILCFEEGDVDYDIDRLCEFKTDVAIYEGRDISAFIFSAMEKYKPNRIFVEANPMLKGLTDALNDLLNVTDTTMLIDALTLNVYYRNMLQYIQDMVSVSNPVIINRASSAESLAAYAAPFRLMNKKAGFLWESPMGYHEKVFGRALPYDLSSDKIFLSESDFPLWYLDQFESPKNYEGKELEMTAQLKYTDGTALAGRRVMTCCANDIQFLSVPVSSDEMLPADGSYIRLKAIGSVYTDPKYKTKRLRLKCREFTPCTNPGNEVISATLSP